MNGMDRQYIRDHGIVERYLRGALSESEEAAFEEAYLGDPELLEEVALTERLRDGLRGSGAAEGPARRGAPPWWSTPRYALAASVVAALALLTAGALYVENRGLRLSLAPSAATTRLLPMVAVRGGGRVNVIEGGTDAEWTVLLLDPGFAVYDSYRATLVRSGAAERVPVHRLDDLVPTYEGLLAFGVPGGLLEEGEYEIILEGKKQEWPADHALDELGRLPLTVTPAPPSETGDDA
jgi:hypothetical protein